MNKRIAMVIILSLFVFVNPLVLFAGGGQEQAPETEKGEVEPVTLSLGTIYPPKQPASVATEWAIEKIKERSNGQITIKHHHSGQLGNNEELANNLMTGGVDMNVQSLTYFKGKVPEVAIDGAFFLYEGMDHVQKAWDGEFGDFFRKELVEKAGVRILVPWLYGKRVITTKDTPVRNPEDLEGVKLRAPGAPIWLDQVSAFGAKATPVAFPELYLALSQGVVDGQENPISVIYSNNFHEVQNYMSLTYHKLNLIYVEVNEKKWQQLSDAQREIIETAFIEAAQVNEEEVAKQAKEGREAFIEGGGTVIEDPDRKAFEKRVLELYKPGGKYEHLNSLRDLCNKALE